MTERTETVEAPRVENQRIEALPVVEDRLTASIEQLAGLSAEQAAEGISRGLDRWLRERAEDAGELARLCRDKLEQLGLADSELGQQLATSLDQSRELLVRGAEQLRGEKLEALVALLSLALLLCLRPEAALEQLANNPALLKDCLTRLRSL